MSNTPKLHNNERAQSFLDAYLTAAEVCEDNPQVDDIFSGVLELKTEGDSSTRSLSRQVLFQILQRCPTIDVASINSATNGSYSYRSLAGYAALARVASKAIAGFIDKMPVGVHRLTIRQEQQLLDDPYEDELRALDLIESDSNLQPR